MPQVSRHLCSNCGQSVFNCLINGQRVPLVFYMVVGQPADTGEPLNVNAPGVKVPSFVRELMKPEVLTARIELCMRCLAEVFGLPLVDEAHDPMSGAGMVPTIPVHSAQLGEVERSMLMHERALHAVKLAHGKAKTKAPKPGAMLPTAKRLLALVPTGTLPAPPPAPDPDANPVIGIRPLRPKKARRRKKVPTALPERPEADA